MKKWKNLLAGILAIAMMLSCASGMPLEVHAEENGDYTYTVNEDGNSVTITKYTGKGEEVNIPSEIEGKKVTSIGMEAFYGCSSLTNVTIPDSVTSIGMEAFYGCRSLTSVTIPDSVTSIGNSAFSSCRGLTSVTIPDSVTNIGRLVFSSCSSLTSVTIPNSVTSIGYGAFSSCRGLTSVTIPDSVTSIEEYAFSGCDSLKSVTIPNSVTSIGEYAFNNCAFKSVTIPNSVTSIEKSVFSNCSLESITIPDSVTSIGEYAFSGCQSLESVTIPDSVTNIGTGAFRSCFFLESVTIPSSVMSIGTAVFSACHNLTSIKVESENRKYDSRGGCNAIIETDSNMLIQGCIETVIPSGVTSIGDRAFDGYSDLTSVTIPSSVTSIGDGAFSSCSGLTSVTIPSGVTSIGKYAFDSCSGLTSLIISNSVTSIRSLAFFRCKSLISVTIPSSVTSIEPYAFGYVSDNAAYRKINDFSIYGENGSEAERYAKDNEFIFKIKKDISKASVTLSPTSYTYDGAAKTPSVTMTLDGKTLALNTDYTVSYSNNINVGTAKATVTGKGNYTGSKTVEFTITKAPEQPKKIDISKASITLSKTSYTYDGKAKTPSVTVKLDGKTLALNTDYTVSYSNNTNAGTAKATVTGKGNYTGSTSVNFTIVKAAEQSDSKITCKKTVYKVAYGAKPFKINATSKSKMTFTSSKPKIAAVNKNTGKVTIKNTGVATITIKAGKASKKVTVKVSPRKPSVKSANTAKGKKLTVKWAKDKMASGYQVQISTDKKFKKNVKTKSLSKSSYTFTKLKTGKKYYVRIRSYRKSGKETLYSAWSKVKVSGKIKK